MARRGVWVVAVLLLVSRLERPAWGAGARALHITSLEATRAAGPERPSDEALGALAQAVAGAPDDRSKRFEHVRGLVAAGKLDDAERAARAWREKDAYNLVVTRLLGDIYVERGEKAKARRTYAAVVELMPRDPEAHRALATVMKQGGDLEGAYARLRSAAELRAEDLRIAFELADVEQRMAKMDDATRRFEGIVASDKAPEAVRYPAKQRLGQIYAAARRDALGRQDAATAAALASKIAALGIKGGVENDIKVYLSWDTDRTDVDLWVTTPAGETVDYRHRNGRNGEALFDDVTSGYGPESFTAHAAQPGTYEVKVNYYGTSRQAFTEARGEVVVIVNEGTALEKREVVPYKLFKRGQTVAVARVEVPR